MQIYVLFDQVLHAKSNLSYEEFFALPKVRNAKILQYRDKENFFSLKLETLNEIRKYWKKTIIVNDDIELAMYADGLHLGQEDLMKFSDDPHEAIQVVRFRINDRLLGLSTHNKEEIELANDLDLDYIGLGAYRATDTKNIDNILGERISEIASYSTHNVAAIGGVRSTDILDNITYLVLGSDLYR